MSERRQAFRRDPIEIDLGDDRVISVGPVPWEQRNVIGNEILKQHSEVFNEAIKTFVTENSDIPQIETKLANKLPDPNVVLHLGLDDENYRRITDQAKGGYFPNQLTAVLIAILEVNELLHLRPLVDPNFSTPGSAGGLLSLLMPNEDDQKTESGPSSFSGDSVETLSENSPTQSLVESSTP